MTMRPSRPAGYPPRRARRLAEAAGATESAGRDVPTELAPSLPTGGPAVHLTRRARRLAEAEGSAGAAEAAEAEVSAVRDLPAGLAPSLPSVRPACTGAAPLPTRRSMRGDRARGRRPRRASIVVGRPGRIGRQPGPIALGQGRAAVVTAAALVATLVVGVGSPQVAVAGTVPEHHTDRTGDTAAAQYLAPSGLAPGFDGRDAYSVAGASGEGGPVASGAVRPVDGTVPTAGGFGGRHVAGCSACSTDHHGLDFAAASGTPVHAVLPGVVLSAGAEGGYGLSVVVRHADGLATRYAHLSRIDARVGQTVAAGTDVGRVGSTGVSTGSHLHFEVLVHGRAIDPAPWLRARGLL